MHEEKFLDVKHVFDDEEKAELADQMADDTLKAAELEKEKKEYDKEQGDLIKARHSEVARRAALYKDGFETQSVLCRLELDKESKERKWINQETQEVVLREPFAKADLQEEMEFDETPDGGDEEVNEEADMFNEQAAALEEHAAEKMEEVNGEDITVSDEDAEVDDENVFGLPEAMVNGEAEPIELPFELDDAYMRVLDIVKSHTGTDPISFLTNTGKMRRAAEVLIGHEIIMGDGHEAVTGLSPRGIQLLEQLEKKNTAA